MTWLLNYIIAGTIVTLLIDIVTWMHKKENPELEDTEFSNLDRILNILFWPLTVFFIIRALLEKP